MNGPQTYFRTVFFGTTLRQRNSPCENYWLRVWGCKNLIEQQLLFCRNCPSLIHIGNPKDALGPGRVKQKQNITTNCLWIINGQNIEFGDTSESVLALDTWTEHRVCLCSLLHCNFIMNGCDGPSVPEQQPIYQPVTTQPPVVRQGTAESPVPTLTRASFRATYSAAAPVATGVCACVCTCMCVWSM